MRGLVGEAVGGRAVAQMCGKLFVGELCAWGSCVGSCGGELCGEELWWGAIHLAGLLPSCIGDLYRGTVCVGAVFGGAVVGSSWGGGGCLETLYP